MSTSSVQNIFQSDKYLSSFVCVLKKTAPANMSSRHHNCINFGKIFCNKFHENWFCVLRLVTRVQADRGEILTDVCMATSMHKIVTIKGEGIYHIWTFYYNKLFFCELLLLKNLKNNNSKWLMQTKIKRNGVQRRHAVWWTHIYSDKVFVLFSFYATLLKKNENNSDHIYIYQIFNGSLIFLQEKRPTGCHHPVARGHL